LGNKASFSAAVSGNSQGAEGNKQLFKLFYALRSFERLENRSTMLLWTAPAGDSVVQGSLLVRLPYRDIQKPPG